MRLPQKTQILQMQKMTLHPFRHMRRAWIQSVLLQEKELPIFFS